MARYDQKTSKSSIKRSRKDRNTCVHLLSYTDVHCSACNIDVDLSTHENKVCVAQASNY